MKKDRRVGAWLIGAKGSVATTLVYGADLLRKGAIPPIGMVTAGQKYGALDFANFDQWVFAGHDICNGSMEQSAQRLVEDRVLSHEQWKQGQAFAQEYEQRLRPGFVDTQDRDCPNLYPLTKERLQCSPIQQIEQMQSDLREFQKREHLDDLIVVNLASTEAHRNLPENWDRLAGFVSDLKGGAEIPASVLYTFAAIDAGYPYINFTPSAGNAPGAIAELALAKKIPHCGRDGKTGETLLKTALAPLFAARELQVLSWEGYNLLGNGDGKTLSDPSHRQSKLESKDSSLRKILKNSVPHSRVSIDYVPSLGDWKTAWDFIHFRGFLNVPMNLQFTWQGCDSALAAPLVLDLLRLTEFAHRQGESGFMPQTASYFKSPLGCEEQDFFKQFSLLENYLSRHLQKQKGAL